MAQKNPSTVSKVPQNSKEIISIFSQRFQTSLNLFRKKSPELSFIITIDQCLIDFSIPTASTNGIIYKFNPAFCNSLTLGQLSSLICHEVLHTYLLHPLRLRNKNHETANKAMDYAINLYLKQNKYDPLPNWLCDNKFKDMKWEEIYWILNNNQQKPQNSNNSQQNNGKSDQTSPTNPQNNQQNSPEKNKNQSNNSQKDTFPLDESKINDTLNKTNVIYGEVFEPLGENGEKLSDKELEETERELLTRIMINNRAIKSIGKHSNNGGEINLIPIDTKKKNWDDELREFLNDKFPNDYTYNERDDMISDEFYIPTIDGEKLNKLIIFFDVSGSISDEMFSFYLSTVGDMVRTLGIEELSIYQFDTKILTKSGKEIINIGDYPNKIRGGGTDFKCIDKIVKGLSEEIVLIFTDGVCDSYPTKLNLNNTVWIQLSPHKIKEGYGKIIELF